MLINHYLMCGMELNLHNVSSVKSLGLQYKAGNNSYANVIFEGNSKEWKTTVKASLGRCRHFPFLGVCEQKQLLIAYLKCYCLNTFAVVFMQGGKG